MTRERWKINVRGKERDLGNVLINEEEELKEKGRERERERKKKSSFHQRVIITTFPRQVFN